MFRSGNAVLLAFLAVLVPIKSAAAFPGVRTAVARAGSQTSTSGSKAPSITSSSAATVWPGETFQYQITATNSPTQYAATGLPSGLTLNTTTGSITGRVLSTTVATVELTATNFYGQGTLSLVLTPASSANLVGTTNNCATGVAPPAAAVVAGYNHIGFCDDFDSVSTIDQNGTGATGFNWYVRRPWSLLPASAYSVKNSVLTLADNTYNYNWGVTSGDIKTKNGHAFTFGYFEARINFDPMLGPNGPGWPSFWSLSANKAEMSTTNPYAELDFFEAFPQQSPGSYYGVFGATLHDWRYNGPSQYTDYINPKNVADTGLDGAQWHVIGCLWVSGQVTWYLDGNEVMTEHYAAGSTGTPAAVDAVSASADAPSGVFTDLDTEPLGMLLILGSGPNWPMNVDWVRVWQP